MSARFDAAVVGAGLAGSAAAAILASAGRRVLLLEQEIFPRHKVCGEYLSPSAQAPLSRLGLLAEIDGLGAEQIREGSIHVPGTPEVSFRLPRGARGVSRYRLDALLASHAGRTGAEVRFAARVTQVEGDPGDFRFRVKHGGGDEEISARAIIAAHGRWNALDKDEAQAAAHSPRRHLAWSRDYLADESLAGRVRLYLFPGGYCGLSRVEGGIVHLAGVIAERERRRIPPGWEAVVAHAAAANADLSRDLSRLHPGPGGFLGTGPVLFTAMPPVQRGMLMAGDAAGMLDPFSGEGQSSALSGGILAAETIEAFLVGAIRPERLADAWTAVWRGSFGTRFRAGALLRRLMLRPGIASAARRLAGESVVRLALRTMLGPSLTSD
ncbi:MAG TPA: FAD-dependent monooxygenase [Thermoanaerobaculia bacterium]